MTESNLQKTATSITTPVLFLVFNRPDVTARVFEVIRLARPPRLYVAADGPRQDKLNESELCEVVRRIATAVDWPCEVYLQFQASNLGCKRAVSSGINWFFSKEEQGIILEDDCLPSLDFFRFAEDMLFRYASETRISMITGTNYMSGYIQVPYFFSEHFSIWGWATWRRAWKLYDVEMAEWNERSARQELSEKFRHPCVRRHFSNTFDLLRNEYVDTWDIQWVFTCIMNRCLCLTPTINLITNIGVDGTHGQGTTDSHNLKLGELSAAQYINFSPRIRQCFEYDLRLHREKSFPAIPRLMASRLARRLRLHAPLRSLYRLFRS
jgi:hypothetical protein